MKQKDTPRKFDEKYNNIRLGIKEDLRDQLKNMKSDLVDRCIDRVIGEQLPEIRTELVARTRRLVEDEEKKTVAKEKKLKASKEETFERFNHNWRLQHMVLLSSCIILILSGIPLKFHEHEWAVFLLQSMGGLKNTGILHRIGAIGLMAVGAYHLLYIAVTPDGRKNFWLLIMRPKDIRDLFIQIKYYLGKSEKHARFGRFSYVEKFDYWAVYWGMVIMVGTGIVLWFETNFPLTFYHIAREAHSDEALLATLSIIIWHFYNVHFNPDKFPMNKVWWTGRITKEEMIKEHPLEYEELLKTRLEKEKNEQDTSENSQ